MKRCRFHWLDDPQAPFYDEERPRASRHKSIKAAKEKAYTDLGEIGSIAWHKEDFETIRGYWSRNSMNYDDRIVQRPICEITLLDTAA